MGKFDKTYIYEIKKGFEKEPHELIDDNLANSQQKKLKASMEEADRWETVSDEEFKNALRRWLMQ